MLRKVLNKGAPGAQANGMLPPGGPTQVDNPVGVR